MKTYFLVLLIAAFFLRLAVRVAYGEAYFWQNGYTLFYDMAQNIAAGKGLCQDYIGIKYAYRPPVYPLFLRATLWMGSTYWPIIVLQSLVGAVTAGCAAALAWLIFDRFSGVVAGIVTALYPYFVMHDTAMQETGLFTCLTTLGVTLLLLARKARRWHGWIGGGFFIGLALLTRATLIVWLAWLAVWLLFVSADKARDRIRNLLFVIIAISCLLAPWLLRNYRLLGRPVLTTLTGLTLWAGNNAYTFAEYPRSSIDQSVNQAYRALIPEQVATLNTLSTSEIAQGNFYLQMAWSYMSANAALTMQRALQKLGAAFSWRQNPAREGWVQFVYFSSYVPVFILGCCGIYLSRQRWRELSLIYALFLSFMLVTAVFFAHTSHRVFLDVYLIVFAAYTLSIIRQRWQPFQHDWLRRL